MAEPSKVIHIRNVGHEISESELLQVVQPFGTVAKLVMLRAKNQALVQMEDLASAVNVIQYYNTIQPSVRGRNVYLQYSSHQELTTDQSSHGRNPDQEEPNRILLVTIHHMLYPITIEVLHQVFSPYGFVEKIVTFQKSAGFQTLIQYQSRQSAIQAYGALHGRNIYDGCCQLDIQYSNLSELQVHYNNDRSRDFTNPSLPTEQRSRSSQPSYNDPSSLFGFQQPGDPYAQVSMDISYKASAALCYFNISPYQMSKAAMIAAAFGGTLPPGVSGINDRCTLLVSNLNTDKIDEDKLFNLFSMYGNIVRIKILKNKPDHALIQMADGLQAELAVLYLKGAMLFGKKLEVNYSKYPTVTADPDARDYSTSHLNRFNSNVVKNYRHCCAPTKMIHISALPQDITEDTIHSLVGEHGTIANSRLFETNGKTQALVLFESVEEATEALVEKHASKLDRTNIRISFSQMQNI
ncbi:polypyrimidine tract-binding protein homolog 3 isoform X1 [Oryza sativa Japonica Group]|nr:polypyrimidine tract-binding protein homolog 3 isoform X1 [Oryza sativa Japonica Group]XP_015613603.1 polypyrimidine tract-binding protein homolog 3 isoform X1 [Oryza sativa Japonica Group]XP_015613605.1 polypyrimidine tract-binding protein homolog 3 isoform X1 [Oryza sativa Japonica Group]XP_052151214.1 polypyrimidine tract-binding protein homolog 3-like isoform X3 [Oryza glaberrima]